MRRGGEEPEGFGAWLAQQMRLRGFTSNVELEQRTGIGNTTISRWRNGTMTPSVDQLRKLEEPLDTPLLELMVRAGLISPEEAKLPRERLAALPVEATTTVADAILRDPQLLDEARQHLLNQYDLLLRVSPRRQPSERRGKQSPRRTVDPSDPGRLRAVAHQGDPEDRAEMQRRAREARKKHGEDKE